VHSLTPVNICDTAVQGPSWRGRRSFTPLAAPCEMPRAGMLVAIDAEFVAVSRAEASVSAGQEVQLKPSRWVGRWHMRGGGGTRPREGGEAGPGV
jgi:hypothetical protein